MSDWAVGSGGWGLGEAKGRPAGRISYGIAAVNFICAFRSLLASSSHIHIYAQSNAVTAVGWLVPMKVSFPRILEFKRLSPGRWEKETVNRVEEVSRRERSECPDTASHVYTIARFFNKSARWNNGATERC